MDRKTIERGRLCVQLDRRQVFLDDPGAGTPALVWINGNSGTYWCVCDTGELMDGPELTPNEVRWLHSINDEVDSFLYSVPEGVEDDL
jgi:hypothetical protein